MYLIFANCLGPQLGHLGLSLISMRVGKRTKLLPVADFVTMTLLIALLSGDLTLHTIPMVLLAERRPTDAHQPTDSGLGVTRYQRRDRFLAEVKTIGGRHQQGSKLSTTLTD